MRSFKLEGIKIIILGRIDSIKRALRLKTFKVNLKLPYIGGIEGTWEPNKAEFEAAWEMYVELVTRVPIVPLDPNEGILREALTSMYSLFDTTRKILREKGPDIAKPRRQGDLSFGILAVAILNNVLRPILAKWHPLLTDYENARPKDISVVEYERRWERYKELNDEIDKARKPLVAYANKLAEVAGVPSLLEDNAQETSSTPETKDQENA